MSSPQGKVIGKKAPDFTLTDQNGDPVTLSKSIAISPALLVFYPKDFTPICTMQLCNYRDHIQDFSQFGLQIFGISKNSPEEHQSFVKKYDFPFLLLSDPNNETAKAYGCTSLLMMGMVSRAVFIVNSKGYILYRYVEPTTITHRKAPELLGVLSDLKSHSLI